MRQRTVQEIREYRRNYRGVTTVLFLGGLFITISYLYAPIHELGHCVGTWMHGFQVTEFGWAHMRTTAPDGLFFVEWGGDIFDRLFTWGLVLFLIHKKRWYGSFLWGGELLDMSLHVDGDIFTWIEVQGGAAGPIVLLYSVANFILAVCGMIYLLYKANEDHGTEESFYQNIMMPELKKQQGISYA